MSSHQCPASRCPQRVGEDMLMCRPHWRLVPKPLQGAVWAAWRNGAGAGSPEHTAAIRAAVSAVNAKLAGRS